MQLPSREFYRPPATTPGTDDRDGLALLREGAEVPYRTGYRLVVLLAATLNLVPAAIAATLAVIGRGEHQHIAVAIGGIGNAVVFTAVFLRMRRPALSVVDGALIWRRGVFADRVVALRDVVRVERQGRALRVERRDGAAVVVPLVFLRREAVSTLIA